jgi:MarR family transcriptional regulator, organic hydroperoxide resistance regulator
MVAKQTQRAVLRAAERLGQKLPRYLTEQFERLHLTDLEAHVLLHLLDGDRAVAELQARLGVAPSTLTGVLDRLENQGLVRRTLNPADRRSFLIHATPAGERAARRISDFSHDFEARVRSRVGSSSDLEAFLRVVEAIEEITG